MVTCVTANKVHGESLLHGYKVTQLFWLRHVQTAMKPPWRSISHTLQHKNTVPMRTQTSVTTWTQMLPREHKCYPREHKEVLSHEHKWYPCEHKQVLPCEHKWYPCEHKQLLPREHKCYPCGHKEVLPTRTQRFLYRLSIYVLHRSVKQDWMMLDSTCTKCTVVAKSGSLQHPCQIWHNWHQYLQQERPGNKRRQQCTVRQWPATTVEKERLLRRPWLTSPSSAASCWWSWAAAVQVDVRGRT